MASEKAVDQAIEALYAAALDPAEWTRALREVSACLEAVASCVFVTDRSGSRVVHWTGIGLEFGEDEYREHYVAIDPRRQFAEQNPATRIHYDRMLIDERGMNRNEFYAWQERHPERLRYFIGGRAEVDTDHSGFAAFHWSRGHGHADAADVRLFTRLAPHFERALQLSHRLGIAERREAAMTGLFERLAQAVVLVDRTGRVVSVNDAANAIISADDGLAVTARRVILRNGVDDAALQKVIGDAVTPPGAGGFAVAARPSGRASYVLLVTPLPQKSSLLSLNAAAAAVFITDPERRRELPEEVLIRLFRFTRAEAALAIRVVTGMNLKQAADDLAITINTARLHLQRVLNKTGTHRQSDLVRLLLMATPGL
jgi:DNA-binding CsgD family transcriptional regulator